MDRTIGCQLVSTASMPCLTDLDWSHAIRQQPSCSITWLYMVLPHATEKMVKLPICLITSHFKHPIK